MFDLLATIVLNSVLFTLFKLFPKYGVDQLQAIVVNYVVCVATGSTFMGHFPVSQESLHAPWFPFSVVMGIGFVTVFNLIAWRTRVDGMTVTTLTNKLSLVIPVLAAFLLYNDRLNIGKIAGVLLSLPAVYFTTRYSGEREAGHQSYFWIVVLFLSSGLLDTFVKYAEHRHLHSEAAQRAYTIHVFGVAAIAGAMFTAATRPVSALVAGLGRNILAGIALGIPNYFSLYFLIRMLHNGFLQSSAAFPVNNIGILLLSALIAMAFFKEPVNRWRILGLVLSVLSIILIAVSDIYG